jgi:hypothetical protein
LASLALAGCATTKPDLTHSAAARSRLMAEAPLPPPAPPPPPPPPAPKPPADVTAAAAAEAAARRAETARTASAASADAADTQARAAQAAQARAEAARAATLAAKKATTVADKNALNSAVRYVGVNRLFWPISDSATNEFQDLYTQLYFIGPDQSGAVNHKPLIDSKTGLPKLDKDNNPEYGPNVRDYRKESRPYLARILTSDSKTVTLLADVEGNSPSAKFAVPLFSITYSSGKNLGNSWATNYTLSNTGTPLIKIGPNTVLTVHASIKVSNDLKSQGAAVAIGAITKAVQIAAPQTTLLNTLSSANVNQTANAIDGALSGLLSYNLSENVEFGQLMSSWNPGSYIVIYGCAPFMRMESDDIGITNQEHCGSNPDIDGQLDVNVGQWQMKLACPRPSVFDARDICSRIGDAALDAPKPDDMAKTFIDISSDTTRKKVYKKIASNVQNSQVMNFELSSGSSILAFVPAQTWYSTFIGLDQVKKDEPAFTEFCAGAMSGLEAVGLNQLDSALVIRAAIEQLPKLAVQKAAFTSSGNGRNCVQMLGAVGVTINP